jgi:hypothetical protein
MCREAHNRHADQAQSLDSKFFEMVALKGIGL